MTLCSSAHTDVDTRRASDTAQEAAAGNNAVEAARVHNGRTAIGSAAGDIGVQLDANAANRTLSQMGLNNFELSTKHEQATVRMADNTPVPIKILPPGPYVPTLTGTVYGGGGTRIGPGSTWKGPYSGPTTR